MEAIQRRHAVIHNDGVADSDYLSQASKRATAGIRVGDQLVCTPGYMDELLLHLSSLAMVLGLQWAHHFGKVSALKTMPWVVKEIYDLEKRGH